MNSMVVSDHAGLELHTQKTAFGYDTYPGIQARAISRSSAQAVYSIPDGAWYSRSSHAAVLGMKCVSIPWILAALSNGRNPKTVVKCLTGGYNHAPSAPRIVTTKYKESAIVKLLGHLRFGNGALQERERQKLVFRNLRSSEVEGLVERRRGYAVRGMPRPPAVRGATVTRAV